MTEKEKVEKCLDKQYQTFIEKTPDPTLEQFKRAVSERNGVFSPTILRKLLNIKEDTFNKAKRSWIAEKEKELKPELTLTIEQENLRLENEAKKLEIEERTKNIAKLDREEGKENKSEKMSKKVVRAPGYPLFENEE